MVMKKYILSSIILLLAAANTAWAQNVATVNGTGYTTLADALNAAREAAAGGWNTTSVTVEILEDITFSSTDTWTPIVYNQLNPITINGNNHTITNLPGMLYAKDGSGVSSLTINNLTFESPKAESTEQSSAVIMGYADSVEGLEFNNVHINNATVSGSKWVGAFIGFAAGYSNVNDGPLYQHITFNNCSVTNSTIKNSDNSSGASVGALMGHANGSTDAKIIVNDVTVTGNNISTNETESIKAGALFGTVGALGPVNKSDAGLYVNATVSNNTVKSNGTTITTIYGRQGTSTGKLTLTEGGSYDAAPIAAADAAWATVAEGNELQENNGTYTVAIDGVAKIGDTEYASLEAAITAASAGQTVELLKDVTLTNTVAINKGITIDGGNFTVTKASGVAFEVTGAGDVTFQDLNVNITSTSDGRAIKAGIDNVPYSGELTVSNCTLTAFERGIDIYEPASGISVAVTGTTIKSTVTDPTTTYTVNSSGTRGLALWAYGTSYDVTLTDCIIEGFSYDINVAGTGSVNVEMNGGKTYGRAAINSNKPRNSTFTLNGVDIHGLNNQTGPTEAFACIVDDTDAANNTYNISNCTITSTISAAASSATGSNASQYLVDLRGTGSTANITNGTTYSTNNTDRGGLIEHYSNLDTHLGNTINFDAATYQTFDDVYDFANVPGLNTTGNSLTYTSEVYYYWSDGQGGYEGEYCSLTDVFNPNLFTFSDGEFIKLQRDVTLTDDITCPLEDGESFYLELDGNSITRDANATLPTYIYIDKGVTVYTDVEIDGILFALNNDVNGIVKLDNSDATYKYKYTVAEGVAHINGTVYPTLAAAVEAATAGQTIVMINDDDASLTAEGSEIEINKPITITGPVDEDGLPLYTIWGSSTGALSGSSWNDIFISCGTGTVTISNLSFAGFGDEVDSKMGRSPILVGKANNNVVLDNLHINFINCEGIHVNGGTFTIQNCNIDCTRDPDDAYTDYTKGICIVNAATGSITGTTITGVDCNDPDDLSAGIELQGSGDITISGCNIETKTIGISATYVYVDGTLANDQPGTSTVNVSNCTIESTNYSFYGNGYGKEGEGAVINISSGTYTGKLDATIGDTKKGLLISGGKYSVRVPMDNIVEGKICPTEANEDNGTMWSLITGSYVARIDDYGYETLDYAVAALEDNDEIILLDDITLTDAIMCNLEDNEAFALTFGNHTISRGTNSYSILLPTGVTAVTDVQTDIFAAASDGMAVEETAISGGGYSYSVFSPVAQIGTTLYATLEAAIAAVPTDGTATTITMIANETVENGTMTIAAGKNIILDLNGKTVAGIGGTSSASFYFITNKGTLEITDNSTDASGKITHKANSFDGSYSKEYVTIYNLGGTLTLTNGTVENTTGGGAAYAINNSSNAWGTGDDKETVFNMTGGTISAPTGDAGLRVYQNCAASDTPYSHNTVNISGGTIASGGIFLDNVIYQPTATTTGAGISTNVTISGGEIHGLIDMKLSHSFNTNLNITGGTFVDSRFRVRKVAGQWSSVVAEPTDPVFTISGGKFSFANGYTAFGLNGGDGSGTTWTNYQKAYYVSGGVFTKDLNTFSSIQFPTGMMGIDNTDPATSATYPYTVGIDAVATIGNARYATLKEAFEAVQDGETIKLLKDVNLNSGGTGSSDNNNFTCPLTSGTITLDYNGHTISASNRFIRLHNGVNINTNLKYNGDASRPTYFTNADANSIVIAGLIDQTDKYFKVTTLAMTADVPYVDENGANQTTYAAPLTSDLGTTVFLGTGAHNTTTWYYLADDASFTSLLFTHNNTANLILTDDKTMTVSGGPLQGTNSTKGNVGIYGQENQTGTLNLSWGGNRTIVMLSYTQNGGNVVSNGSFDINTITVNEGNLSVTGNGGGYAPLGRTNVTEGSSVTINGGKVDVKRTATSGSNKNAIQTNTVTITGGELTAESTNTAIYAQGNITITGGKTTVKSNDADNNYGMEAGGSITMSLTKNDEYINSINGKYRAGGSITIPNGLYAQGTGDFYQGTVAAADIDNKKLVLQPYEAVIDFGGTTGEVFYLTLAEADDHDENGTYVIRLLHNIESPYEMRTTPDNTMRIFRDGRNLTIASPRGYIVKAETNEETVNVDGVPVNNAKVTTYTSIPVNVAIDPATYNGEEQTPNVTITMLGQGTNAGELTLNTDYKVTTVSETGYTNAAEYVDAIRIQGIVTPEDTQESGYIADIYSNFTILPLNLPDFTITAVAPYLATGYGANNSESGAAVLDAATISIVDGNGKDWTNLGIFTVTIDNDPTATNNYNHTGSYQGVVHITPKVDDSDPNNVIDYSTNFTGVIPAGNLVIGGDKDIATSNITATVIYTGSAQKPTGTNELYGYPTVIVKDGLTNAVLAQGTDYDLEYENTYGYKDAQTYSNAVTIRGINDYHGVKTVDYIITPKNIADCNIIASTTFTGSVINPADAVQVSDPGLSADPPGNQLLAKGTHYTLTVSQGYTYLAPQTYANAITVTGTGNYTGSVTKDFVITSTAAIDLATAAVVLSKQTYTGANLVPTKETTSVTVNGTPLTEGTDYTFSFIPEGDNYYMDAKTYSNAIIIKAKEGNATYYGTAVGNYIIEPRDLSDAGITVTTTDLNYLNREQNVTVVVKYGNNVIDDANYTYTPTKVTEAGHYDITITAVENSNLVGSTTADQWVYKTLNGDYATDFTVEPDPIPTQTYTGSEIRPTIVVKDKDRVMQLADANGGDYSVEYTNNINEGEATITITGRYAYSGTITKHFYIINEYFTVGDFTYHHAKEGEEVNLGKKEGANNVPATGDKTGKIEVPETVDYQGKTFTVTGIEEKALGGADITAVVLPQSIAEIEDNAFQGAINTRYVDASAMSGYVPETLTRDFDGPFGGLPKQALVYLTGTNIKGENYVYKPGSGDAYYCEVFKIYDDLNGSQTGFDGNDYKWAFENVHKFTAYTVENTRMLTAGKHYTTCLPYSIDIPRNVKAYTLDATSGQIFGFKEVETGTIEAYKPYVLIPSTSGQLLSATDVEVDVFPADATTDATKLNGVNPANSNFTFYGTMRYMEGADAAGKYIMQYKDNKSTWLSIDEGTAGFNESNRACILPMRAYIASTTGGARSFTATFTDIDGIIRTETFTLDDEDTVIYDLSGRRVELLEHGHTYIINGKKVIVK